MSNASKDGAAQILSLSTVIAMSLVGMPAYADVSLRSGDEALPNLGAAPDNATHALTFDECGRLMIDGQDSASVIPATFEDDKRDCPPCRPVLRLWRPGDRIV